MSPPITIFTTRNTGGIYYTIKLQCFQCRLSHQPDELVVDFDGLVFFAVDNFFFVDDDFVYQLVEDSGVEFGDIGVFFYQLCE